MTKAQKEEARIDGLIREVVEHTNKKQAAGFANMIEVDGKEWEVIVRMKGLNWLVYEGKK